MPRDFDQNLEQDLEFKIGGETFKMRYVRPEVLSSWEDEPADEKSADALKRLDERVMSFLNGDDDSRERWRALREREENPISMGQMNDLLLWMVEVQSGRPTPTPLPSASGRGRTAASSRAG